MSTDELERLIEAATDMARLPWYSKGSAIYSDDDVKLADQLDPLEAALIVAAVNALPELVALRKENERLREQVRELSDCQRLPKVYTYTGTAEVDVENMFDVGHRHRNGKQPRDYLMSWLSMFRPFAYATKDDSWGELEKLISIVMNNYVQILVRAEKARAALNQEGGQ